MGKGVRGREGGAHRLTPQNTVPLPKAKFDPPIGKIEIFQGYPLPVSLKNKKNGQFSYFFHFFKEFFAKQLVAGKKNSFYPLPTHTLR